MSNCIDHGKLGTKAIYYKANGVWLHRKVLATKLGRALLPNEVTRHTCDNKRCVNPEHLIVGSHGDNVRDAFERGLHPIGSDRPNAVLDEATVLAIRAEYVPRCRTHGTRAIAKRLGVSQWTISHAIRGITWKGA